MIETTECMRCGQKLELQDCGCWTDARETRHCGRGSAGRHRPSRGVQPERCNAPAWPPGVFVKEKT